MTSKQQHFEHAQSYHCISCSACNNFGNQTPATNDHRWDLWKIYNLSARESYLVSDESLESDLCSSSVIAVLFAAVWYTGPCYICNCLINSSLPGQYAHHFPDDIFKYILMNEMFCILIQISIKFVSENPINNMPAFVHIMDWRPSGDKLLSEPMLTQFTDAYIYGTRGRWVKLIFARSESFSAIVLLCQDVDIYS